MAPVLSVDDGVLMIGTVALVCMLWRWQRATDTFDMRKVIVDGNGDVSLAKIGQMVALLVSTWVLIHETRAGKVSEWLFTGYMLAWAGANLISKVIDKRPDPAMMTSTVTATKTTVIAQPEQPP